MMFHRDRPQFHTDYEPDEAPMWQHTARRQMLAIAAAWVVLGFAAMSLAITYRSPANDIMAILVNAAAAVAIWIVWKVVRRA